MEVEVEVEVEVALRLIGREGEGAARSADSALCTTWRWDACRMASVARARGRRLMMKWWERSTWRERN